MDEQNLFDALASVAEKLLTVLYNDQLSRVTASEIRAVIFELQLLMSDLRFANEGCEMFDWNARSDGLSKTDNLNLT